MDAALAAAAHPLVCSGYMNPALLHSDAQYSGFTKANTTDKKDIEFDYPSWHQAVANWSSVPGQADLGFTGLPSNATTSNQIPHRLHTLSSSTIESHCRRTLEGGRFYPWVP